MLPSRLQLLKSVLRVFKPLGLQPALAGSGSTSHRSFSSGNQFQPQLPQPSFEPPQSSAFIDDSSTATSLSPGTLSGSSSPDQGVQAANGLLVQPQGSPKDGVWAFVEEQEPEAVPQLQPEEEAAESVQTPNDLVLPKPLAKARQEKGLKPGAWDPSSMGKKIMQRNKELRDRSLYLKNMWYAVGEGRRPPQFSSLRPSTLSLQASCLLCVHQCSLIMSPIFVPVILILWSWDSKL